MRAEITKVFKFEAAHSLIYHQGQCRNLHGHSYKAEVTVAGLVQQVESFNSESGMVVDFGELSTIWKESLSPDLDHGPEILNDMLMSPEGQPFYPTAEHLAAHILRTFRRCLDDKAVEVVRVKLWETDSSYAVVN